jgi:hypothetical protein
MTNDTPEAGPCFGWEQLDAEAFVRSLTGFDELAIEKTFRRSLDQLPATVAVRAMVYVRLRREGAKDTDAYRTAMGMPLGDVEPLFRRADPEAGDSESGEA